jgi:hypothetical protein
MRAGSLRVAQQSMTAAIGVSGHQFPGKKLDEIVQFITKRDLERARLIQEARAIYEGIFPTEKGPIGR